MTLDVRRVPSGQCRSPCEFHMAAPDEATEPVNLGNPAVISIRGLAERVIALTGSRFEIIHHAPPADDPAQRQQDITRARELLEWKPKVPLDGTRREKCR